MEAGGLWAYAYYDYINFGHYPHEFAALPRLEKAVVMAFIDKDIENRRKENAQVKSASSSKG